VLDQLSEAVELIGGALYADGYYGLVGVDAVLGPDGTLYPCLEINARFNMSTYQNRFAERYVTAGRHAIAATIGLRPSRPHGFDEVERALAGLLLEGDRGSGVLVNNFATLNAAAEAGSSFHGRIYVICVADSPDAAMSLRVEAELRLQGMVDAG
jgi:hypothetical protein